MLPESILTSKNPLILIKHLFLVVYSVLPPEVELLRNSTSGATSQWKLEPVPSLVKEEGWANGCRYFGQ